MMISPNYYEVSALGYHICNSWLLDWFNVNVNVNGLLFHMTQPTSRSIIKAIARSKPTISEHWSKWKHNGTIVDQCKQRGMLCHIGLAKDRGGHLVNQPRLSFLLHLLCCLVVIVVKFSWLVAYAIGCYATCCLRQVWIDSFWSVGYQFEYKFQYQ